jgi:hypothetical protein
MRDFHAKGVRFYGRRVLNVGLPKKIKGNSLAQALLFQKSAQPTSTVISIPAADGEFSLSFWPFVVKQLGLFARNGLAIWLP